MTTNNLSALIWTPALAVVLAGTLQAADADKLPPPADKPGVTFVRDIRPIFQTACVGCHGPKTQKGELRLDSLEAVLKGSEHGKVLEPGNSAASPLVRAIARLDAAKAMPPKGRGNPLSREQVGLVRAWIDQGAK